MDLPGNMRLIDQQVPIANLKILISIFHIFIKGEASE